MGTRASKPRANQLMQAMRTVARSAPTSQYSRDVARLFCNTRSARWPPQSLALPSALRLLTRRRRRLSQHRARLARKFRRGRRRDHADPARDLWRRRRPLKTPLAAVFFSLPPDALATHKVVIASGIRREVRRRVPNTALMISACSGGTLTGNAWTPRSRSHANLCRPSIKLITPPFCRPRAAIQTGTPFGMNAPKRAYRPPIAAPVPPGPM